MAYLIQLLQDLHPSTHPTTTGGGRGFMGSFFGPTPGILGGGYHFLLKFYTGVCDKKGMQRQQSLHKWPPKVITNKSSSCSTPPLRFASAMLLCSVTDHSLQRAQRFDGCRSCRQSAAPLCRIASAWPSERMTEQRYCPFVAPWNHSPKGPSNE